MTAPELAAELAEQYGVSKPWPAVHFVDHETYANVIAFLTKNGRRLEYGPNGGVMFKAIELIELR